MEKNIYTIKLHETIQQGSYLVTRVPGGWIYSSATSVESAFVPYNKEFIKIK